jgi:hypothetical protein
MTDNLQETLSRLDYVLNVAYSESHEYVKVHRDDIRAVLTALMPVEKNLVDVDLDLTEAQFVQLASLAHENDITINQQIEKILSHAIEMDEDNLKQLLEDTQNAQDKL